MKTSREVCPGDASSNLRTLFTEQYRFKHRYLTAAPSLGIFLNPSCLEPYYLAYREIVTTWRYVARQQIFLKEISFHYLICSNLSAMPPARYSSPGINVRREDDSVQKYFSAGREGPGTGENGIAWESGTSFPYPKEIEDGAVKRNLLDDLCPHRRRSSNNSGRRGLKHATSSPPWCPNPLIKVT